MSEVADQKVAIFHYTLTNDAGEVMDSSEGQEPLPYLHGAGNIIPGLEAHMLGKKAGDSFDAVIPPSEAYGEFDDGAFLQVPKAQLPEGIQFQRGAQLIAEDENGHPTPIWMDGYDEGTEMFTFTLNHPLAGMTLTFQIQIVGVRDATEAELEQGVPHGIDGTQTPQ